MSFILIICFIVNYRRLRFTVLMDDVWVVIGLLLFGSLLFCLCCYKVSNLLYMLYHIDDDPDSAAPNPGGGTGDLTAVGVASAANAAAAAVIASATSGLSAKGSFKATATKTNASPTDPDPDRVQPGVSNARVNIQRVYHIIVLNDVQ